MRILYYALISGFILVSGCANQAEEITKRGLETRVITGDVKSRTYERSGNYENSDNVINEAKEFDRLSENTEERAEALASAVTALEDVVGSSVYIAGNTAIVGIAVDGEIADPELIKLKKEVENRVKTQDRQIERVAVTASLELLGRINSLMV